MPAQLNRSLIASIGAILFAPLWLVHRTPQLVVIIVMVFGFGLVPFLEVDYRVAAEVILYALSAVVINSTLMRAGWGGVYFRPWRKSMLLFLVLWLVGILVGIVYDKNDLGWVDARRYVGWLALFPFCLAEQRRIGAIHRSVMIVTLLGAIELILQAFTSQVILAGMKGTMVGATEGFDDVKRGSIEGANYLLVYIIIYCAGMRSMIKGGYKAVLLGLAGATAFLALILVFSRGLWLGALVGGIIAHLCVRGKRLRAIAVIPVVLALATGGVYAVSLINPHLTDAIVSRIISVKEEGDAGTSVGARFDENVQAWESIEKNPVLGLGHGGEYKKMLRAWDDGFVNEATFIHNAYLWFLVKFGILGALFVGALIYLVWRNLRHLRKNGVERSEDVCQLAALGTFFCMLISGMSTPFLAQYSDLIALSAVLIIISGVNTRRERFALYG